MCDIKKFKLIGIWKLCFNTDVSILNSGYLWYYYDQIQKKVDFYVLKLNGKFLFNKNMEIQT